MATLIKNVRIMDPMHAIDVVEDVFIDREAIRIAPSGAYFDQVIDGSGCIFAPGLIDLHVHFREPGFVYKESIRTGIAAALRGGVTSALVMPNTSPPIDEPKRVAFQMAQAKSTGFNLMVAACATVGLRGSTATNVAALTSAGIMAVTDDGKPIACEKVMEQILKACRLHDIVCMQHAEDLCMSRLAPMHEGYVSKRLKMLGQPREAETSMIERDIALATKIGARYHVLHISCKESLQSVAHAQRNGALVSCEVTPHHLLLSDADVVGRDTFKKMNPPLRTRADAQALIDGLSDGRITAVASDHAPHSLAEKRLSFEAAPFGVVGLESAMLVLLTLVKRGKLTLARAIESMTVGPARIISQTATIGSLLGDMRRKDAVLLDPNHKRIFSRRDLAGRSINSAFLGMEVFGQVRATFLNGNLVYRSQS